MVVEEKASSRVADPVGSSKEEEERTPLASGERKVLELPVEQEGLDCCMTAASDGTMEVRAVAYLVDREVDALVPEAHQRC